MEEKKGITELAYMLAQQEEPGGRFTDRDIELQSMRLTNILQNPKMLNNLAYMLAQQEEPGGRLSEGDIMRQINRLKSLLGSNKENKAQGGRIGYQTGGISETRTLPPEYIEAAQKTFLADLTRQAGIPSITTATAQQPGETAEQFAARQAQAQQFGITKAGMADLAPQVAAQDPLQVAAYAQAVDPTTGLGAYQPFLTKAGEAATAATGLTGPLTGAQLATRDAQGNVVTPNVVEGSFMSPYQTAVIDETLAEFDRQAQAQKATQAAQALGIPGAFGGGREGVLQAEYQSASDRNRAALQSGLLQQGFQQAQSARQQDLANQMGLANLQSGLGARAQDFSRAQISGLGT